MIRAIARLITCGGLLVVMAATGSLAKMLFVAAERIPADGFLTGFQALMMIGAGIILTLCALVAFCIAIAALTDSKFPEV